VATVTRKTVVAERGDHVGIEHGIERARMVRSTFAGIGAVAGVISALTFTVVHHVIISSIWFALPAMLGAGAVCGACLAWSYGLVSREPSTPTWLRYNLLFLSMFIVLGLVSMIRYEPITTIAALLQTKEPPTELIGQALPMTGMFIVMFSALMVTLYRPNIVGAFALLVTTAVMVAFLGLNISILGLVDVPSSQLRVLGETFGLLVALTAVYVAIVTPFVRRQLIGKPTHAAN
jgi:hypothetical protein